MGLNCHAITHPLKVIKGVSEYPRAPQGVSGRLRDFGPEPSSVLGQGLGLSPPRDCDAVACLRGPGPPPRVRELAFQRPLQLLRPRLKLGIALLGGWEFNRVYM